MPTGGENFRIRTISMAKNVSYLKYGDLLGRKRGIVLFTTATFSTIIENFSRSYRTTNLEAAFCPLLGSALLGAATSVNLLCFDRVPFGKW